MYALEIPRITALLTIGTPQIGVIAQGVDVILMMDFTVTSISAHVLESLHRNESPNPCAMNSPVRIKTEVGRIERRPLTVVCEESLVPRLQGHRPHSFPSETLVVVSHDVLSNFCARGKAVMLGVP